MSKNDQLAIPTACTKDKNSFEVLRVWIADNNQHISIRVRVWEDPAAWGIMLADLAKHIVNSYGFNTEVERQEGLMRIKTALLTEIESPTE